MVCGKPIGASVTGCDDGTGPNGLCLSLDDRYTTAYRCLMASWRDTPPDNAREARALGPMSFDIVPAPTSGTLVNPVELIGAGDVLALCGWKQRKSIHDARARAFPEPVAVVSGMRLWVRGDVERWQTEQETK